MHGRDILYHWATSPVWVSSFQKGRLSSSLYWCPRKQTREHFCLTRGSCLISLPFIAAVQASSLFPNFANNYITTSQKWERCDHLVTVVVGECQSPVLNKAFKHGEGKHTISASSCHPVWACSFKLWRTVSAIACVPQSKWKEPTRHQ